MTSRQFGDRPRGWVRTLDKRCARSRRRVDPSCVVGQAVLRVPSRTFALAEPRRVRARRVRPEDVPFVRGGKVWFFTVVEAAEDRYIAVESADTHLTAYCVITAEPAAAGQNRFHVVTVVKYHRWTGPLYFNLIRPFHHLVVRSVVNAGSRGSSA